MGFQSPQRPEPHRLTHEEIDARVRRIACNVWPGGVVSRKADAEVVQAVNALLSHIAAVEQERDELALTLANERGEGPPPSEGWAWDGALARWRHRFGWCVERAIRHGGWSWNLANPFRSGNEPTARAAMVQADAAGGDCG